MEQLTSVAVTVSGWALPILALWILIRCVRSMLREHYEPEIWAYLEDANGGTYAVNHWETILGRSNSCDIILNGDGIARTHAALIRSDRGHWTLYDLDTEAGTAAGTQRDEGKGVAVEDGSLLSFGSKTLIFRDLDEKQRAAAETKRCEAGSRVSPAVTFLILSIFQVLLLLQFTVSLSGNALAMTAIGFAVIFLAEWAYYLLLRAMERSGFEPETLAFFLSTLGVAVTASAAPQDMMKQILLLLAGIVFYLVLGWWLRDLHRTRIMRRPVAALALALLALNLAIGTTTYGAQNWLSIGGFSLQPSEFVKVAYIYAGASTLDRLYRKQNLFLFIAFSAACVGALALMGDFGTALIFFLTFLVISFLRSGSFATVFLAVAGAVFACFLILTVKPYIAQRFAAWGHIWEDPYGSGWQQTRALSAAAGGGLFGVGAGNGWLSGIFAADTDLVFCLISEELGLLTALCAMLAVTVLAFYTFRNARRGRSSYYVIAGCATASMMIFQLALNVFGCTDLLPFTGVTFPFVSRGGSSLISCWGLLAFLKASDTRRNASAFVRRSIRKKAEAEFLAAQVEAERKEAEEA